MYYNLLINDMTWSYSRIKSYNNCPYMWFLKYLLEYDGSSNYFSEYGKYMHEILEKYLAKEISKTDLVCYYILNYKNSVSSRAPSLNIQQSNFLKGKAYLENIKFPYEKVLGVEQEINFELEGTPFTGFIDVMAEDNGVVLIDHKSRNLKNRSTRKKPTKTDLELDEYLKQLYLYSNWVKDEYGVYPIRLEFNCFKNNNYISEPFVLDKLKETNEWAMESIKNIKNEGQWNPNMDYWFCNNLCDMKKHCEYIESVKW